MVRAIFLAKERGTDGLWKGRGKHVHKGIEYILRGSTHARRQEGIAASPLQGFSTPISSESDGWGEGQGKG